MNFMNKIIKEERWQAAQLAESQYWDGMNLSELLRICAEKPAFLDMLDTKLLESILNYKEVLEIGVGPLGISLVSFYPSKDKIKSLTKLEPLARVSLTESPLWKKSAWANTFLEWVHSLSEEGDYLQAPGEKIEYYNQFDTAIIYNVLDHVQQPLLILKNTYQALRSGGWILVGVDCRSLLGRLKFEYILRRIAKGEMLVEAHPHTFLPHHVVNMLQEVGFQDVQSFGIPGFMGTFAGSTFRPAFIGKKPAQ